jgi:hypothetical protein
MFRSEHGILFEITSVSGGRIGMYLADARNLLVGRLNTKLFAMIIFMPDD